MYPWCRQRLSNHSFSEFLQAIKELNSGKKTREDTLHTALEIFGSNNGDLYSESMLFSDRLCSTLLAA